MSDDDPARLADQLDQQAREMEKRSGRLSREIKDAGEDWERKRADESVPGAQPDHDDDAEGEEGEQARGNAPQGDTEPQEQAESGGTDPEPGGTDSE